MAKNINSRARSAIRTQSRKDVRSRGEKYKLENKDLLLKHGVGTEGLRPHGEKYKLKSKECHSNRESEGCETTWREI